MTGMGDIIKFDTNMQLKIVAFFFRLLYNMFMGGKSMGQKEKLIQRLKTKPKNFTFEEAEALLGYFDDSRSNKGKTSGSRVIFENEMHGSILLHKPHPQKELKSYQVKQLLEVLEQEGLI